MPTVHGSQERALVRASVRPACVEDAEALHRLTCCLIESHRPGFHAQLTVDAISRAGFGVDPLFEALAAEVDRTVIGFVSFFRGYAGWRGRPMGIVHALYVGPEYRQHGIARQLMAEVARLAVERDWIRIELFVEEGLPAIEFYEAIGMIDLGHRHYRLEADAMTTLAAAVGQRAR